MNVQRSSASLGSGTSPKRSAKTGSKRNSATWIGRRRTPSGSRTVPSIVVPAGTSGSSTSSSADAMTAYAARTLMSPVAAPVVEYEQQALSATTLFKLNSATLSPAGEAELRVLAGYINGHDLQISDIKVNGYTCDLGPESYNQGLSQRRAGAVAGFLARQGVPSDLMEVSGMGESNPIASNSNEAGRAQNRRVEVHIGTIKPQS